MDGLEKLDTTHAVFSGFTSVWRRAAAFFGTAWLAHFVGLNIYSTPGFISNLRSSGLAALTRLEPLELVWLPIDWIGTMFMSFNHVGTFLYVATLAFAFLATMRSDAVPRWVFATIVAGQPLDTFMINYFDHRLRGLDLVIAGALLTCYFVMAVGGCYWWWCVREDHEE